MTDITRRAVMASGAALAAATPALAKPNATPAAGPWIGDATDLAAQIRSGKISAVEAVETAIRNAEALQPKLNFIVNSCFDRALDAAKKGGQTGPFAGVPFLIKDLHDYAGLPTRSGSRSGYNAAPAAKSEPLVEAYERAGFIVIGKSASPEFGYLPTTEPLAFGPTHNPWNPGRSSGGSSGGAAAAVASGVIPIAHASDGGGSIRIPASCCGLFGLKPSRGRMIGAKTEFDVTDISVQHAETRTVRDSALLFAATENPSGPLAPIGPVLGPSKRRLKVGMILKTVGGEDPDEAVAAAFYDTAKLLKAMGHGVKAAAWPVTGAFTQDFLTLWAAGAAADAAAVSKAAGRPADETLMEPFSLAMAQMVAKAPPGTVEAAIGRLTQVVADFDKWISQYDVVVSPVLAKPPVPLGYVSGDVKFEELSARLTHYVGYTPLENVAGAPAMSVPLHWTADGLPVGVHFIARRGQERTLFELAYALEAAQPWAHRKPPISV
ncbi:amidase [Caulobacter ginsengisoli]|uniref:Amidase n=1 Tax=Caulobacter ginsengisoli TaxID=400775 RepID=A0ABU0IUU9_9CAUL|nr:amidase [Caulobacter ginsengisoli]MDQ0465784.1 amidase [Caulobacter ginsengisoli]